MNVKLTRGREVVALGAIVIALYLVLAYGLYSSVTSHALGANDFYSRWEGARALFLRGENPYSDAVTREIQLGMYGRLARPDEDQVAFAYPLYSAFLAAPLAALPYAQAQAAWMAFLILAIAGGTIALAHLGRATRPLQSASLLLLALFFYPSVRAIFNGQYAIPSFFFISLAIAFIAAQHDSCAGVCLILATVKPQPALFLVPAILVWCAWNKRWQVLIVGGIALGVLMLASFALVPTWVLDFVNGLRSYSQYEPIGPPLEIVIGYAVTDMGWRAGLIAAGVLALIGSAVWRVSHTLNTSWEDFLPTLGFIAILTTIWAGRIGSSDQVLLLIPWVAWLNDWIARKKIALAIFAALVLLILPWIIFFATLRGDTESIGIIPVLPFLSLAIALLRRGDWA